MIKAVSMANGNNNAQNNVNFKGTGQLVNAVHFRYDIGLVEPLRRNGRNVNFIQTLAAHLRISVDMLKKCWAGLDFEKIGAQFEDLRGLCKSKETSDRPGNPATLIASTSWKNRGLQSAVGDFEPELRNYLTKTLNVLSPKGTFEGVPLQEITVIGGSHQIPNNYRRVAHKVVIKGSKSESPILHSAKFNNLEVSGANMPNLQAEADFARITGAQIGGIEADAELYMMNSTIKGNATSEWYAVSNGDNQIGGILRVGDKLGFFKCSKLHIMGDVTANEIAIPPGARLIVDGSIGTENDKVRRIILQQNESSLKAGEVHARRIYAPTNTQFETRVLDAEHAPLKIRVSHLLQSIGAEGPYI